MLLLARVLQDWLREEEFNSSLGLTTNKRQKTKQNTDVLSPRGMIWEAPQSSASTRVLFSVALGHINSYKVCTYNSVGP